MAFQNPIQYHVCGHTWLSFLTRTFSVQSRLCFISEQFFFVATKTHQAGLMSVPPASFQVMYRVSLCMLSTAQGATGDTEIARYLNRRHEIAFG